MDSVLYDRILKDRAYAEIDILPKDEGTAVFFFLRILEKKSVRAFHHSLRVGMLAAAIGQTLGVESHYLPVGGYLHDIGKIKIPQRILMKTGTWTSNDRAIMKRHVLIGYRMLKEYGLADAADVIVLHHRFQEKPYPKRIPKVHGSGSRDADHIRFCGRIVALADCYDALHRNYEWPAGQALDGSEIQDKMIELNSDQTGLINRLYDAGIFI